MIDQDSIRKHLTHDEAAKYLAEALRVQNLADTVKVGAAVGVDIEIAMAPPGAQEALRVHRDSRMTRMYEKMAPPVHDRPAMTLKQIDEALRRLTSVQHPPVKPVPVDWQIAAFTDLALQRKEDLRASPLYHAATSALTVLRNMARENPPAPWWAFWRSRWPISAEPLRSDARHNVPALEAALGVGSEGSEEDGA